MAKKSNPNAATINGVTAVFRASFSDVFETAKDKNDKDTGKYKLTVLFDPSDKQTAAYIKKVQKECILLANKVFDCKNKSELEEEEIRWNPFLTPKKKQIESWGDAYEGMLYVRLSSKFKPQIVDGRNNNALIFDDDTKTGFYSGCYARMLFTGLFAYSVDGNQGVSLNLNHLQKFSNGEPLTGGVDATSAFEALPEEDDTASEEFDKTIVEEVEDKDDPFA